VTSNFFDMVSQGLARAMAGTEKDPARSIAMTNKTMNFMTPL